MGALIMLGTLFGLIAVIFTLVWTFDPEMKKHGHVSQGDRNV